MLITPEYLALNRQKHATSETYGTSGYRWAEQVRHLARSLGAPAKAVTILDYGCGKGTLRETIWNGGCPEAYVLEYDPAIPGKDGPPAPADIVVCGDVLEHIEPDCLYSVLDDIQGLAKKLVFLVISTKPAQKTLPDGRNAHLIVEPLLWWFPKLAERWSVRSLKDFDSGFTMIGQANPL